MNAKEYVNLAVRTNDISAATNAVRAARFAENFPTQLWHAGLVITEIAELFEFIDKSRAGGGIDEVNLLEEVGDVLWYLAVADAALHQNGKVLVYNRASKPKRIIDKAQLLGSIESHLKEMVVLSGRFIDLYSKKYILYGKPYDPENLLGLLHGINQHAGDILAESGFDIGQARMANINKLKKRYPDGFTEDKAMKRDVATELSEVAVVGHLGGNQSKR